ncbi:MFS transporter [Streptococcus sanguinis]|nr:MFS transporter [Streptococcus sanguinis]MBF1697432.1 MFS transporter [Streptococcus cristatus]MBZ2024218.1 MFS transporter [Streptococcus sanguinis]MBZ2048925.1 MFS transporter [Streptococcus sanguinis]MBZ2051650.1 MFS transporter [Streptococcus sanguinis]MBZ2060485.1 MFS transporter [Streptococcus sanguinis]
MGGVENIQMAYFLPFGAGLIALHTISILFVSRISLIKRLFLVVWVMLFAIGAPFLFQQVPGIAFVGLCALALAVYMVLLFSQELAPVKKKATASTRSRSQKHAKSSRKKVQAKEASLSSARDLNFSNASTGRMRKESKERVQAEESPVRQRVSASGRTLADRSIKKDMTRYEKVKPLYPVDNLATAPAFGEYEPNSQLAAAEVGMVGMEHSSQKANDEFLQSLLHHRKGSTKIKVANSLIQPTEANAAGNQGYTDIDDPAFETAVLSKIRPMSYTESSYGNFRPQAVEVTGVVSQDEEEFFTEQEQAQQPVAEEVGGSSLEDVFAATGDIKPVRAEESKAANSLESLFFAEEKAESEAQMDSVFSQASAEPEFSAAEESMVSRDRADIQGYQDILSQIQHDLLGSEEEDLTAEVAETWEEESNFEPAAETFEFEEAAEPAVVQSVSEDTLWTQAEPVQEAVADETEEDLLKGITDILKAEEVQIKASSVAPAADETEEDLLQKITDILKAEEAAEAQPAATTAGDKEVYFQFLLLESQELLASNAVQEAESYLKEIVQGSSDQNLRQEAFNMLDKIGKN